MIHKCLLRYLTFTSLVSSLRGGLRIFCGTWLRCNSLDCNGAPERCPRGAREAEIGQRRGCPTTLMVRGRLHPTSGSHLPPEGTAQPCVVAFRVVAPYPAPQKLHTPPRPTAGFRLKGAIA